MAENGSGSPKIRPWLTVERLSAITDGVMAIIITILVLEIEVPEDHDFGRSGLFSLLGRMARDIVVYFLGFGLIWAYWVQHHAIFHYILRVDRYLIFLNGVFLFLLSLSPFTTELAGTYKGVPAGDAVFGINFLLSGFTMLMMWRHAVRNPHLLRKTIDRKLELSMNRRIMLAPAICLVGVVVSAFEFRLAALIFLSIPLFYTKHWLADTQWQEKG